MKTLPLLTLLLLTINVSAQKFTYHFSDASMAPEYNRSYTIIVQPSSVDFTVLSYDTPLYNEKIVITTKAYKKFVADIKASGLKNTTKVDNDGCTGGTTDTFSFEWGKKKMFKGSAYNCGRTFYGDLEGNIQAAKDAFISMVPTLTDKVNATRK